MPDPRIPERDRPVCPRPWLLLLQEWAFAADFHHHPQGEPPLQGKNQSYQRNPAKSAEVTAEFRIKGLLATWRRTDSVMSSGCPSARLDQMLQLSSV
ncbi:hypothetical protein AFERRI_10059 [Acidithiobacillus ferrivorans]|uniref:Uncharacterized protein n=1 Tax=Acidithiobacillus ferrivorans TaxID=160808 RepID=A0A060UV63_9PROT|nr:hypothetical protein AFERRI_10059 [Acidithiobacillus ferrivorans]